MPMTPSHGSAISPANRPNDRPLAANASRFVRFDTGSSSDPEFDRCVQAYRCGLARASSLAAVANTTGVSSTTVASRLSTAVVTAATANTRASSRCGRPAAARASHAPQARNSPSSSHSCASTSTAARKPMTGPSRLACSPAVVRRDRAGGDHEQGGRHRSDRLRQATRPPHRPAEDDDEGRH